MHTMTGVAATLPLQLPTTPLQVPQPFAGSFDTAITEGIADAAIFAGEHRPSERWAVPGWALLKMKWPPKGKEEQEELAFLRQVATQRTADQNETAKFYSDHGITDAWEVYLAEYVKTVGPRQARAATKLLHDAMNMVNEITQTAKAAAGRKRPFVVDPTMPLLLEKPGESPSYPSGHTSAAVAAAMVLGYLMPGRRDEFASIARQASWARIYGGVHFPSDVVAGAKLAATVTSYLCQVSGVEQAGMADARAAKASAVRRRKRVAA